MFACAKMGINADSFFDAKNKRIFEACQVLSTEGKGVDPLLVAQKTKELGAEVPYLELDHMVGMVAAIAHVGHYAEIVKNYEVKRTGITLLNDCMSKLVDESEDPRAAINAIQTDLMILSQHDQLGIKQIGDYKEEKIEQWKLALENGYVGIPSQIPGVNKYLGGYRKQVVTILGAYRGVGKSTLARQDALELSMMGYKVAVFTLEDPGDIASACMVGNKADMSTFALDTGNATPTGIESMAQKWDEMADLPLYIVDKSMETVELITTATIMKQRYDIDIIYIDHVQFLQPYNLPGKNRNDTVATYSQQIVTMSKVLDVPVIVISQLSREAEKQNRKPKLSDLRDSGTLEADARQIMLLSCDEEKKCFCLEIAKNNFGQSEKDIWLDRIDGRQRFAQAGYSDESDGVTEDGL